MRLHAASPSEDKAQSAGSALNRPRKRSSPAANAVALFCAAGLLVMAVWDQGAALLTARRHLYLVLGITLSFAAVARLARGVNTSGALAGAAIAFVMASRDLRMFWVLLVVFFVTLLATRAGASRKHQLKMAEAESGRSASQVMSNLGVSALVLAVPSFSSAYLLALAALAEVAADTTSSEVGTALSTRTVLITTWKPIPPGTDGGISVSGTVAGTVAALIIAGCAAGLGITSVSSALLLAGAGVAGMLVDSLLGAVLERRGYLNNDLVNLLSTAASALLAWLMR